MDSIYPKFGEVELVLVEDDNDFFDPLETNFECEEENEDVKLQLNDTVPEEDHFQFNTEDFENDPSSAAIIQQDKTVKPVVPKEICDLRTVTAGDAVKVVTVNEIDADDCYFEDNDSNDTDDVASIEIKPNIEDILKSNDSFTEDESNETPREETLKGHSETIEQLKTEKRTIKIQSKANRKPKATHSKKSAKNVAKSEIEQPKEELSTGSSEDKKSTRHYSKRNEVPKQSEHNEAYDKKLLFCKICNLQFERSPAFTEHMREKHSIDKPFECYICSKAYRISSLLAEHIRYHFGEKPYKCKFCNRSFSQLQPYKAHVRKTHTLERPYKCNFVDGNNVKCAQSFFDTKTYKFHLREHTNDQPFTCEFCTKKFNHSGTYQAHMRIHTLERPFQCVVCGKSFAQISTHKAHMLTHSDEFKFPCTECDKKFKQATNLKLHLRVHTKETPYRCEDCGRGFAQLVTYRNHRRIHTGEKPFVCTYSDCGKCFRHRNSFRRHLQTHTGEKPFECKVCFKRLSQTSSYVSHMRRHEKPEKS